MFCQNYDISKATKTNIYLNKQFIEPQEIIELAKNTIALQFLHIRTNNLCRICIRYNETCKKII